MWKDITTEISIAKGGPIYHKGLDTGLMFGCTGDAQGYSLYRRRQEDGACAPAKIEMLIPDPKPYCVGDIIKLRRDSCTTVPCLIVGMVKHLNLYLVWSPTFNNPNGSHKDCLASKYLGLEKKHTFSTCTGSMSRLGEDC